MGVCEVWVSLWTFSESVDLQLVCETEQPMSRWDAGKHSEHGGPPGGPKIYFFEIIFLILLNWPFSKNSWPNPMTFPFLERVHLGPPETWSPPHL